MMAESDSQARSLGRRYREIIALIAFLVIVLFTTPAVFAESLVLRDAPNLNLIKEGAVHIVARSPDGGLILAGDFRYFDGVRVDGLARLDAQGNVDPDWLPASLGVITALAGSANGEVFAAVMGPEYSAQLLKLTPDGQLDPDWGVSANARVNAMEVDVQGRLLLAGDFSAIAGEARSGFAVLDPVTGLIDPAWPAWSDTGVQVMRYGPDGKTYLVRRHFGVHTLHRIEPDGTLDSAWSAVFDGGVLTLAVTTNGDVIASGQFNHVNGVPREKLARVLAAGSGVVDPVWNPTANWSPMGEEWILGLDVDAQGAVYVSGLFEHIAGAPRRGLVKLQGHGVGANDPDWVLPTWFDDEAAQHLGRPLVHADHLQIFGGFLVTGVEPWIAGAMRLHLDSGALSRGQQVGKPGMVSAFLRQANGGAILAGDFFHVDGAPRDNLVRVDADWKVDPHWNPALTGSVATLVEDGAGGVIVGGLFNLRGQPDRRNLVRLDGAGVGGVDDGWLPDPDGRVSAVAVAGDGDGDGAIYVAGQFQNIGAVSQAHLARVSPETGLADPVWNPEVIRSAYALLLDETGLLYASHGVDGAPAHGIWRYPVQGQGESDPSWFVRGSSSFQTLRFDNEGNLLAAGEMPVTFAGTWGHVALYPTSGNGMVAPVWSGFVGWSVSDVALASSGYIYVTGQLPGLGGLARFRPSGSLDDAFPVLVSGRGYALHLDSDETLYVGGTLGDVQGVFRSGVAAFNLRGDSVFSDGFEP